MPVFLTKKQKAQMRERRRKKKQGLPSDEPQESITLMTITSKATDETLSKENEASDKLLAGEENDLNNLKKRPREDDVSKDTSNQQNAKRKRQSLELQSKMIDGKLHVVVPNQIPTKDMKKFRKDARRQLRMDGKDVENVVFVDEDDLPPGFRAKKKKTAFPSIKELLKEKELEQESQKEAEKLKQKIQQIPDDVKSQYVALDCEMVGIGTDGKKSALARVSIVDWDMNVVLDSFVKVPIRVTDFRTHVSGVEPKHIKNKNAMDVEECRNQVAEILKDKTLVGHALTNDFKALMLNHPKPMIRDTAKYRPFQRYGGGKWRPRKLRDLVKENLKGKEGFQEAEHDSVQDARATMELFQLVRVQWEKEMAKKK